MTDERIDEQIDVIAKELDRRQGYDPNHPEDARLILAALRDAGFDVYRPDDCNECGRPYGEHQPECPPVVPVGGDS